LGAFTYPRSEPGSAGHQDLVERLNSHAATLRRELEGLSESAASYRPAGGEWSIKENLGHLRDYGTHFHARVFRMVHQEEPRLPSWDQDEEMRAHDPQSASLRALLDEYLAQRAETIELLADLVHWNWARQGRHAEHGRISIRQLVDRAIEHEAAHLERILQLKAQAPA
jgi:DNA-binding IclR family transcriptional regulator